MTSVIEKIVSEHSETAHTYGKITALYEILNIIQGQIAERFPYEVLDIIQKRIDELESTLPTDK